MTAVRPLRPEEAASSARIHQDVLGMEFLARFGPGFLTAYHREWIASPGGLALAAVDSSDRVIGVVLASLDPAGHYRWMLVRGGPRLAPRLISRALTHPALARDLLATRAVRYMRAAWRQLVAPASPPSALPSGPPTGEVTHLMVSVEAQGTGAATALLAEVERRALDAGVLELVLVTPPDLDARHFYEHLGWEATGRVVSRSGEPFIRFVHRLAARDGLRSDPGGTESVPPGGLGGLEPLGRPDGS